MTTPTRQEIIEAHKALESLLIAVSGGTSLGPFAITSMSYDIRAALPPKPRPTMEGVKWDNKKHFLAVVDVDHEEYKKAIMLKQNVDGDTIQCFALHPYKCAVCHFGPALLTPTGERYTLTEVQE